MSLRLSFNEKNVDRSKNDTVHMFININTMLLHMCIQFFLQFFSAFPPNQQSGQSQSMDEIKLNACAEINNKQNYLPSYFLLNLVLEIT